MSPLRGKPSFTLILSAPKRILIVEDDAVIQSVLRAGCEKACPGVLVDIAESAEDATRQLDKGPLYDLVIADISLSGSASGLDLWSYARGRFPGLPFLFVSSMNPGEFHEILNRLRAPEPSAARSAKQPKLLSKPFLLQELLGTVRDLINATQCVKRA